MPVRESARPLVRALLLLGLALPLLSCDLLVADRLGDLPQGERWTALPMRGLLSRPTVAVEALQFCRLDRCGFDAVVGRFHAEGEEAERLRRTLARPGALATLLARPLGRPAERAETRIDRFDLAGWTGVRIVILGQRKRAHGIILEAERAGRSTFVVVVADKADVAAALARAAAG
jgi:hypothetical protein